MTLATDLQALADREVNKPAIDQESRSLWECQIRLADANASLVALQATYDAYVAAHP